jgi:hypothetical protein
MDFRNKRMHDISAVRANLYAKSGAGGKFHVNEKIQTNQRALFDGEVIPQHSNGIVTSVEEGAVTVDFGPMGKHQVPTSVAAKYLVSSYVQDDYDDVVRQSLSCQPGTMVEFEVGDSVLHDNGDICEVKMYNQYRLVALVENQSGNVYEARADEIVKRTEGIEETINEPRKRRNLSTLSRALTASSDELPDDFKPGKSIKKIAKSEFLKAQVIDPETFSPKPGEVYTKVIKRKPTLLNMGDQKKENVLGEGIAPGAKVVLKSLNRQLNSLRCFPIPAGGESGLVGNVGQVDSMLYPIGNGDVMYRVFFTNKGRADLAGSEISPAGDNDAEGTPEAPSNNGASNEGIRFHIGQQVQISEGDDNGVIINIKEGIYTVALDSGGIVEARVDENMVGLVPITGSKMQSMSVTRESENGFVEGGLIEVDGEVGTVVGFPSLTSARVAFSGGERVIDISSISEADKDEKEDEKKKGKKDKGIYLKEKEDKENKDKNKGKDKEDKKEDSDDEDENEDDEKKDKKFPFMKKGKKDNKKDKKDDKEPDKDEDDEEEEDEK